MLKMRIFEGKKKKKNCEIRLSVGATTLRTPVCPRQLGGSSPDPRVVTPSYYYNFSSSFLGLNAFITLKTKQNSLQ